jgi:tetratricopeptide (TPR) repeat protein
VRAGLSAAGARWAFTSTQLANWHPLTWLSHQLDVTLFGMAPAGHHLTSLLLHLANTALLFFALRRLTRAPWRSLAVAALFALHPLHVESVAWISERKDVLSTAFGFAALWAYAAHVERPSAARYGLVALLFALGLLAKPMLVTLPLTLLILDLWPLRRVDGPASVVPLVVEKLPLFALSLAAAAVTWLAQRAFGAVTDTPLAARFATAVIGAFGYLEKAVWPVGLAAFYPYRAQPPALEVVAKAVVLVLLAIAAAWLGRRRAYLRAGGLWYVVTLLPVIGLVRIGQQEMADRYTYVPLVGVFWMLAWGVTELVDAARAPALARRVAATAALLVCALLALGSARQVATWRDGVTLWQHVIAVGGNSTVARTNLGVALEKVARFDEAVTHLEEAVRLEPLNERAQLNLGDARFALQHYPEAIVAYEAALRLAPADSLAQLHLAMTHYNYANHEWRAGRLDVAVEQYREGLRWRPDDAGFHRALGMALAQQGHVEEAAAAFRRSLELDPTNVFTRNALEKLPHGAVMR